VEIALDFFGWNSIWFFHNLKSSINTISVFLNERTVGVNNQLSNLIMKDFELEQNYPNPFNPITSITYSISKPKHVVFEVYGISGQKVATLVSGFIQSGKHSVRFDASNIASGVYFYRLKTPSLIKTGKMLLVR